MFGVASGAFAQSYPSRPVKIVVPFPAGGPLDFTTRLLTDRLSANMKQPFIVENRPGAAGNIGTDAVAKASGDGYTLLVVLDTPLTVNPSMYAKLPFNPDRDFAPISTVHSWRKNGIPPARLAHLRLAAEAAGKPIPDDLLQAAEADWSSRQQAAA